MPGRDLLETLDRTISICARRETVFRYFTDSARFARGRALHCRRFGKLRPGGATGEDEARGEDQ